MRDNYYYEEPPRSRGGRAAPQSFEDISSYSSPGRRRADQLAARRPRRKPGGGKRAFKTVLLLFALLVLAGGLYVFGYMLSGLTMTSLTKDKDALGIAPGTFTDSSIKNIALFGVGPKILFPLALKSTHKKTISASLFGWKLGSASKNNPGKLFRGGSSSKV